MKVLDLYIPCEYCQTELPIDFISISRHKLKQPDEELNISFYTEDCSKCLKLYTNHRKFNHEVIGWSCLYPKHLPTWQGKLTIYSNVQSETTNTDNIPPLNLFHCFDISIGRTDSYLIALALKANHVDRNIVAHYADMLKHPNLN